MQEDPGSSPVRSVAPPGATEARSRIPAAFDSVALRAAPRCRTRGRRGRRCCAPSLEPLTKAVGPLRLRSWSLLDPGREQVYHLCDARRTQVWPAGRRIDIAEVGLNVQPATGELAQSIVTSRLGLAGLTATFRCAPRRRLATFASGTRFMNAVSIGLEPSIGSSALIT